MHWLGLLRKWLERQKDLKASTSPHMLSVITNRAFDEIAIGDSASMTRTLNLDDIALVESFSGILKSSHADVDDVRPAMLDPVILHGIWAAGLVSTVLCTKLPGPGAIYLNQELKFGSSIGLGTRVTATVTVTKLFPEEHQLSLDCRAIDQGGNEILRGAVMVQASTEHRSHPVMTLPEVRLTRHERFSAILAEAKSQGPYTVAVVHPCDVVSLQGAVEAAAAGLIDPVLVGPEQKIRAIAEAAGIDVAGVRVKNVLHSHAAAAEAVKMAKDGAVKMLMKGAIHTDELMHEVLLAENGLRTSRRLSHVYVMDVPSYPRPLLVTDAAINIAPGLEVKRDIAQNAIDLARMIGIERPKVAVLAAVETVNPAMSSTLDAAALSKMGQRGQITGGIVDGPLALDNAVSPVAAAGKCIVSEVAGRADILLVPNIEAGNMVAKQLTFLAGAEAAGVVVGARIPVILTSRADDSRTRLASCAVAIMMAAEQRG